MPHPLIPGAPWDEYDTVTRKDRLAELAAAGYVTPRNGCFRDMKRLNVPLVLYLNPFHHCGRGKGLWLPSDGDGVVPTTYCSEFRGDPARRPAVSFRSLYIGRYWFRLRYESHESWMSNVDGTYEVIGKPLARPASHLLRYPLVAVDSVNDTAVDLNVCPGVPLEVINLVGRIELREALETWEV